MKFNPGLLFPWAERVIWQDAKLIDSSREYGLPSNYLLRFNCTVQRFDTCSSFMGLPRHKAFINTAPSVTFTAHCDTIIVAAIERPSVSDNLEVLRTQCESYKAWHRNSSDQSSQVFNQAPLVDSAFIVYDMRSKRCQEFNGDVGCSWLDEIHCLSDHTQISFPRILAMSELLISPE